MNRRLFLVNAAGLTGLPLSIRAQSLALSPSPETVLLLRHAYAPGTGDPPVFRIGDCSTQRNLDDAGRRQASRMGESLKQMGFARARVWSSQWCRCLETARLLDIGPVQELPALNSFFSQPQQQALHVSALRDFLSGVPLGEGPMILVTHQVLITALTGSWVDSGEGAAFSRDAAGKLTFKGPVQFR